MQGPDHAAKPENSQVRTETKAKTHNKKRAGNVRSAFSKMRALVTSTMQHKTSLQNESVSERKNMRR